MQIKVNQKEIEAGVAAFLKSQGVNVEGQTVSMTFTAGRKKNGLIADVSIGEMSDRPDDEKEEELPPVPAPGDDEKLDGDSANPKNTDSDPDNDDLFPEG